MHRQWAAGAFFLLTITLATATAALAQGTPYLTQPLKSGNYSEAILSSCGGSLTLSGEAAQAPRVEVYITSNMGKKLSQEEIERRLNDLYEIVIETSGDVLKAEARCKSGVKLDWRQSLNISFKVFINSKVNSNLRTSGGSITMDGLNGQHQLATSGGSLRLGNLSGTVKGSTSGGTIYLSNSDGDISLRTSGGSINADNSKGTLQLNTSGGSIRLSQLNGNISVATSGGSINADNIRGDLNAKTSGGSIRIGQLRGSVDAATSGGSVNANIIELGKYVKLRTSAGGINLTMPGNSGLDLDLSGTRVNVPSLQNFSGSTSNTKVRGTIQGGGIPVSATSGGGSVNLNFTEGSRQSTLL